jgi:hypothetical protein
MITLNSDRGLVRVEDWEDICTRPGFTGNLNPAKHQLASIIGRYVFGFVIRCGLSNCHTPHTRGYIVTTKDGLETNIGKDCGKVYFGVDFEEQARQFDRDMTDQENRELLWNFTFKIDEFDERVRALRAGARGAA